MAKNTFSSTFRTLDIDKLSDNNVFDDDEKTTLSAPNFDVETVIQLLMSNQASEALILCLEHAHTNSKDEDEKDLMFQLVLRILMAIRSNQVESVVAILNNDQLELLMKFVYRGFESPLEGTSAHLLFWHDKIFELTGVGAIVRVLTDRKKV